MLTKQKIYKINDKPVSPMELVYFAEKYNCEFSNSDIKTTGEAAFILRKHGFIVKQNDNIKSEE